MTLARYVRHAELYGFDADYFAIAARDLDPLDLGRLNLRLQRLEPKWRLPQDVARTLAMEIVGAGESPEWACAAAGCSRRTLNRALTTCLKCPTRPGGRIPERRKVDKHGHPRSWVL